MFISNHMTDMVVTRCQKRSEESFQKNGIIFHYHCDRIYEASSPSLDGVLEGRRSTAGCDLVSRGEVGLEGGEVAMLSRSSKLAKALEKKC